MDASLLHSRVLNPGRKFGCVVNLDVEGRGVGDGERVEYAQGASVVPS